MEKCFGCIRYDNRLDYVFRRIYFGAVINYRLAEQSNVYRIYLNFHGNRTWAIKSQSSTTDLEMFSYYI